MNAAPYNATDMWKNWNKEHQQTDAKSPVRSQTPQSHDIQALLSIDFFLTTTDGTDYDVVEVRCSTMTTATCVWKKNDFLGPTGDDVYVAALCYLTAAFDTTDQDLLIIVKTTKLIHVSQCRETVDILNTILRALTKLAKEQQQNCKHAGV